MVPVKRKPAARAASGSRSPSSQAAWCGSPQAICTTSTPRRSVSRFSSGTLLTCSDQLHTPTASGSMAMREASLICLAARRRLDLAAERAEVLAVGALFVERADLVGLQLRHFLRTRPDDGPAAVVGLHHQLKRALD